MIIEPLELGTQEFADQRATLIMEEMRKIAGRLFGVTVSGPYVTLRFSDPFGDRNRLVQVSMQVTNITDSEVLDNTYPDLDK